MSSERVSDSLFEIPDFWRPSSLLGAARDSVLFHSEGLESDAILLYQSQIFGRASDQTFKLPDLDVLKYEPFEDSEPGRLELSSRFDRSALPRKDDPPDDVWRLILDEPADGQEDFRSSWEAFSNDDVTIQPPTWLSEAGPDAFNAILDRQAANKHAGPSRPVKQGPLIQSMIALGLGRSSVLFTYQDEGHRVTNNIDNFRATGCSPRATRDLCEMLRGCGIGIRRLKQYVDRVYAADTGFAGQTAFAHTIASVVESVELAMNNKAATACSMIHLQSIFSRPVQIMQTLTEIVLGTKDARTTHELCSILFQRLRNAQLEPEWIQELLRQILVRSSQPWLDMAEEWLGFRPDQGMHFDSRASSESFVENLEGGKDDSHDITLLTHRLPVFISADLGQTLFEAGRSFRLLVKHNPSNPLLRTVFHRCLRFKWQFEWDEVQQVDSEPTQHDGNLRTEEARCNGKPDGGVRVLGLSASSKTTSDTSLEASLDPWCLPDRIQLPSLIETEPDRLQTFVLCTICQQAGAEDTEHHRLRPGPDLAARTTFDPLIQAQAHLVNHAVLLMLFNTQHLRRHLDLQRQFHLLGNGMFIQMLISSLFDTDVATTERQLGVLRGTSDSMGLRLGDRKTWPPASSELRLALAGTLSECYDPQPGPQPSERLSSENRVLPGNLSFAVRQLSENEAKRIVDPTSLYAVDFLRLQYTSSSPLNAVLTTRALDRYDDIFRFLLRIVRLNFVVTRLPHPLARANTQLRQALRLPTIQKISQFRQQASVLMQSCMAFFFNDVIRQSWSSLMDYLDDVQDSLSVQNGDSMHFTSDMPSRSKPIEGIYDIGRRHEAYLDQIASGLFLRSKQQKVKAGLEEALQQILSFADTLAQILQMTSAKQIKSSPEQSLEAQTTQLDVCCRRFSMAVKHFIRDCRDLEEKQAGVRDHLPSDGIREPNKISRLLLLLDLNGFYSAGGEASLLTV